VTVRIPSSCRTVLPGATSWPTTHFDLGDNNSGQKEGRGTIVTSVDLRKGVGPLLPLLLLLLPPLPL
jgi:hypothetical protein